MDSCIAWGLDYSIDKILYEVEGMTRDLKWMKKLEVFRDMKTKCWELACVHSMMDRLQFHFKKVLIATRNMNRISELKSKLMEGWVDYTWGDDEIENLSVDGRWTTALQLCLLIRTSTKSEKSKLYEMLRMNLGITHSVMWGRATWTNGLSTALL